MHLETGVVDTGERRLGLRLLDEPRRDVDPERRAGGHHLRELLRRIAEAAANVEHAVTARRRVQAQRLVAERGQLGNDDVAIPQEAVEQDAVPRVLGLEILGGDVRHASSLGPPVVVGQRLCRIGKERGTPQARSPSSFTRRVRAVAPGRP